MLTIEDTIDALTDRAQKAERERDEARAYGERLYAECAGHARTVTCVWCGHEFPEGTPASQDAALLKHAAECTKHPMAKFREERDEAREELETWAEAWREYRMAHDTLGDGSLEAGRKWNRLTQLERGLSGEPRLGE